MRLETFQVDEFPEVFKEIMDDATSPDNAPWPDLRGQRVSKLHHIYWRFLAGNRGTPISDGKVADITRFGMGHFHYETPPLEGLVRNTAMRLRVEILSADFHHPLDFHIADYEDRKDRITMRLIELVNDPRRHQELRRSVFRFYLLELDRADFVGDGNYINGRVKKHDIARLEEIERRLRSEFGRHDRTAYQVARSPFSAAIAERP